MTKYYNAGNPNRGYGGVNPGYGGVQNPRMVAPQVTEDWYTYGVTLASLAAGATANQAIQIQADSDFELWMTTVSANEHGAAEPWSDAVIIPITLSIQDGGSGRQLMSSGIPLTGIAGNGKQPFILPVKRRFLAKSTVNLTFVSFSANQWDNIYLNLIGRKIFALG